MTDEFWHGIWWVRDVNGGLRDATLSECATEIQRLRGNMTPNDIERLVEQRMLIETQRRTIASLEYQLINARLNTPRSAEDWEAM